MDDLFPHAFIRVDTLDVGLIEPEAGGRFGSAVAGNTVLVQNPSMLRAGTSGLGINRSRPLSQSNGEQRKEERRKTQT
ncbi:MAG: hypothetical protein OXN97_16695 [Bryobacterales bacterium]|nr:hypothetical protein [Bryobacterales bacterium]